MQSYFSLILLIPLFLPVMTLTIIRIKQYSSTALKFHIRIIKPDVGYTVLRSVAEEKSLPITTDERITKNFITNIIDADIAKNKHGGRVLTRFPPEPNGYLHLGHAKSIVFNFGVAKAYHGLTNMRFDDTNPAKEDMEYVRSILDDVRWLIGGDISSAPPWNEPVRHASDYFQTIYDAAEYLIVNGKAYVDDLSPEDMKKYRGTLTEPGKNSPFRTRSIDENLMLFRKMKAGEFQDGHCVLRALIDMNSPNINLRDPTLYRIKKESHPITMDQWCIYPMYDFAHAISDAIEGITHSLCTLEFENHRPLYDWIIDELTPSGLFPNTSKFGWRPQQIEFSRLNLQYTVLSKRKLIQLVKEKYVDGWDDPRMPTICGLRRRGIPSSAIRLFCERVGISKTENNIDMSVLEDCVREVLDFETPRVFAIMNPLLVEISNWSPTVQGTEFTAAKHPKRPEMSNRALKWSSHLYIDQDDFFDTGIDGSMIPPKGYNRLLPGGQVRLKYGYVITCDEVVRDQQTNEVIKLICRADETTKGGVTPPGSKRVKGIIQWLSKDDTRSASLSLYDRLFKEPMPGKAQEDGNFLEDLNPNSLKVIENALVESNMVEYPVGSKFQFERIGYFALDQIDKRSGAFKFNRIVTLKDTWSERVQGDSDKLNVGTAKSSSEIKISGTDKINNVDGVPMEDILRMEFRVGKIISVEKHPDAELLYVEKIDCGDATGPRTIISGLVKYYKEDELIGRKVVVMCNLKPAKMRGIVSEGMVLAASTTTADNDIVELVTPPENAPVGELITFDGTENPKPDPQLKSKSALDAWKRVSTKLMTNRNLEAAYESKKMLTSCGPCTVKSLGDATIR